MFRRWLRRILNLTDVDGGRITFQPVKDGGLEIVIQSGWDKYTANVSPGEVDKLVVWMNQTLPGRPAADVTRPNKIIPLFRTPSDSTRSPRRPK